MRIKINKRLTIKELDVYGIVEQAMNCFPPPPLTEEEVRRLAELRITVFASEGEVPAQFFPKRWEIEVFIWKAGREAQLEQLRAFLAHELFHAWETLRDCKYRLPISGPWSLYYLSSPNEFCALYFETFFSKSSTTVLFDWLKVWATKNGHEDIFERRLQEAKRLFRREGIR